MTPYQFVAYYHVSYSQDGITWDELPGIYKANEDSDTEKTNLLPADIEARFIRLLPSGWDERIAMRFDVTGCAVQGGMSIHILIIVKIMSVLLQFIA